MCKCFWKFVRVYLWVWECVGMSMCVWVSVRERVCVFILPSQTGSVEAVVYFTIGDSRSFVVGEMTSRRDAELFFVVFYFRYLSALLEFRAHAQSAWTFRLLKLRPSLDLDDTLSVCLVMSVCFQIPDVSARSMCVCVCVSLLSYYCSNLAAHPGSPLESRPTRPHL